MFEPQPSEFTLVTAQQIKTTHATVCCLHVSCNELFQQPIFLVYERTGIFFVVVIVDVFGVLSLLGKVHLAK